MRITSDEIQDDELIELDNRNRFPLRNNETQYDNDKMVLQTQVKKTKKYQNENEVIMTLESTESRSKSDLKRKSSKIESVKKTTSKLVQGFERFKSLTKIRSHKFVKSPALEVNFPKINIVQMVEKSNAIIENTSNLQPLSDKRNLTVKITDDLKVSNDKSIQYNDVCIQNKCPLDCQNILKEKEAAEKLPVKASTKKRCYLIRSKTREKIKSKSMSDLSESQRENESKKEETNESGQKTESVAKVTDQKSTKMKANAPSTSSKKGKCYGPTQKPKQDTPKEKDDKKGKKKTRKCYYYRKRSKVDKKPEALIKQLSPPIIQEPSKSIIPQEEIPIESSVEEIVPLADTNVVTVIPSHETFPSSTITIPTISETTIPTEFSHESIEIISSSKETPETTQSEAPTPSDEVQQEQEEEVITHPKRPGSCMLAGPPSFKCNEDYTFPEIRERLRFNQNRGPIPPCLQPVLGPCEGRRCTMMKGGLRGQACGVKYATVKITFFPEYTTYEVMRSTEKAPKCIPKCIEEVFVTKYEPKSPLP